MARLDHYWYSRNPVSLALWPLSWLFRLLAFLRRLCYRSGLFRRVTLPVPVVIVGNITVGGSGKTPLVLWLARYLADAGYRPGIVSRGYGGASERWPIRVTADSDPEHVGDEAVLLASRSGLPMAVGPDRVAAAELLIKEAAVDLILSDDGLQHYRLGRDVEIAVLDGSRRLGNGFCLPAGPLREPASRLQRVDFIICNGEAGPGEYGMCLLPTELENLLTGERRDLLSFTGRTVHAVAGIGNPQRFFDTLREQGVTTIEHPFPDHHPYRAGEIDFDDPLHLIMTEKDGVKWRRFANEKHWQLTVEAELDPGFGPKLLEALKEVPHG